ncbi:hypothetical protein K435DRAFT_802182 [Dendrothele bispora CBS 962.96]|uniref:Uncharacterized protein n=1 Tax=Dendrothele bispora (strain CBS 962.96) TaxID=1314807 RepID=A0A4S8LLZ1_DENBC|nr:hypothetical protein K435DRAFT_802182 [Dendrothele bispora CBS 962.96]
MFEIVFGGGGSVTCIDLRRQDFTTEFAVNDFEALDSWVVRAIDCQTLISIRDLLATLVDVWPEQLDPSHIHLLIVDKVSSLTPSLDNSPSLANGLSPSLTNRPSLAGPPSLTDPPALVNPPFPSPSLIRYANGQIFLRRVALLEAISKLLMSLEEPRVIQLRGSPGTGKSVLLEQLCHYFTSNPISSSLNLPVMTMFVHEWPSLKSYPTFEDRFKRYVHKGKPYGAFLSYEEFTALCKTHTVIVLHDEAQMSFDEQQLWSAYDSHPNCYVIAAYYSYESRQAPSESRSARR